MKQKQRIALFGMVAVALIFSACGGDSGNNGTEVDGTSSSSGDTFSSSSLAISSSNAKVVWNYLNPDINYGEMTDGRDGQTYKTVVIGTQTWMAENLNYADSAAMPNLKGNSWCYGNSADNCAKYGRLYTWTAAMNIACSYQSTTANAVISTPHQGVCPSGWHVPTGAEWTTLENAVGGSSTAGTALKSINGWRGSIGTDNYGFSALPAGALDYDEFSGARDFAFFWGATEVDARSASYRVLIGDDASMYTYSIKKSDAYSVRCVKD